MKTEKPDQPFYRLSVEETLATTASTAEGISRAESTARL